MKTIILNGIELSELLEAFRQTVRDEMQVMPKQEKIKPYLTLEEAAEFTGLSRSTLYRLTSSRQIPHLKRGGKLIFNREELIAWLQSAKQPLH